MIYICKGANQCCKGCGQALDGFCTVLAALCDPCSQFLDKPLGLFVLGTILLNALVLIGSGVPLLNGEVDNCPNSVSLFCVVDSILAVVHCAAALYLQRRFIHGLQRIDSPLQDGKHTAKDMMEEAGRIVLYDVGFCIYFFIFAGAFCFQFVGLSWVSSCEQEDATFFIAPVFSIVFALAVINFGYCWWFLMFCDDCCGGGLSQPKPVVQQKTSFFGPGMILKLIFGNQNSSSQQQHYQSSPQHRPQGAVLGAPVQGVPVQPRQQQPHYQASHPHQPQPGGYSPSAPPAGAGAGAGAASSVAPQQQQQQQSSAMGTAAKVAGTGLDAAGKGLQMAGKWLSAQKK